MDDTHVALKNTTVPWWLYATISSIYLTQEQQ